MDTITYTCSISAIVGVLFVTIKHFNNLYVSNTKVIIQQNDQIKFLLEYKLFNDIMIRILIALLYTRIKTTKIYSLLIVSTLSYYPLCRDSYLFENRNLIFLPLLILKEFAVLSF